jgi:hypothetical protein
MSVFSGVKWFSRERAHVGFRAARKDCAIILIAALDQLMPPRQTYLISVNSSMP